MYDAYMIVQSSTPLHLPYSLKLHTPKISTFLVAVLSMPTNGS